LWLIFYTKLPSGQYRNIRAEYRSILLWINESQPNDDTLKVTQYKAAL